MLHWKDLTGLSDEQLGALDVAEVNLACAADLPDAPTAAQAAECIARLNHYAKCVRHFTDKKWPNFVKLPQYFDNSEGKFRIVAMLQLLRQQFGVRYDPAKIPVDVPLGTAGSFIHGALLGEGGTCASLPVVYAAVGRRLGYPLKLARTMNHCFTRWDDPKGERFNIEVSDDTWDTVPDDYYRTGRHAFPPEAERCTNLLKSQTPRQELSEFLVKRGYCWLECKNHRRAAEAFAWSWLLSPNDALVLHRLVKTTDEWAIRLHRLQPPGFPPLHFSWPPRRFPPALPLQVEKNILYLEALEEILVNRADLHGLWWMPMRQGRPVRPRPLAASVGWRLSGEINLNFMQG